MLGQCATFRKIFDEKHKVGDILFQEGRVANINELPFPEHQGRGKIQEMMASQKEMEVEGYEAKLAEGE